MSVEAEFNIEIPDEHAERLATVEDYITYILLRRAAG
jgi:acyl carrier protein